MLLATFKHISSKNSDYGAAEKYLLFEHDEFTNKPVLDERGRLIPRENCRIATLNCGDDDFAIACMKSNLHYGKNRNRGDVKSHHYIISFDPRDGVENGLTVDRAQELGEQFCRDHFAGHQAIVCTHSDGHNHFSRDDENFGDSVSIETQKKVLRQYVSENNLIVYDEYVDDGWSGTNFERPAFQRMISDIEAGKVNCVVTKDLSRFGREHVTMDYYLEFVFPEMNVRYIAVNDNEDTDKGLSDFVPFKNLFNEFMAKDTSRKVKAALHAKFAAGERTFSIAPFGYMRHPEEHNKLAVDPDTAWIIEKIFDLAVHGAGAGKITKILVQEKIPTAGYIDYKKYGQFAKIYENAPAEKAYAWVIRAVCDILKDETYIGNSVHGKQTNVSYKNKKSIRRPESEWFRVENTHEPIISKDIFNQVQKQIASRRRPMKSGKTQIFAGLVKCADCGWSLSYCEHKNKSGATGYFNCSKFRQLGKVGGQCTAHYIRYDTLYTYVLARLQDWISQAHTDEKELLNRLLKTSDKESAKAHKKQSAKLAKAEKRKAEVDRLFVKLYEDV